jgi:hypothetical protein
MKQNLLTDANLSRVADGIVKQVFNSLNCVRIGKVISFNPDTLTAEIQIQDKRELNDNTLVDYPLLVDVPCFCLSGANGGIDIPIQPNDTGILLFNDRNIDKWWGTGTVQKPDVYRCHDWSDALFLCGIRSLKNLITDYLINATRVRYKNNSMIMGENLTTFNNPIQAAYKANDGTAGITTTQTIEIGGNVVKTMTIKNGLIVGIS